ncbi:MAG TPA: hypothetical protein DD706_24080, partial [Nitrospiraceae bacterium]|nr:hypothetical protein [Nitrospiraceae bacterium]
MGPAGINVMSSKFDTTGSVGVLQVNPGANLWGFSPQSSGSRVRQRWKILFNFLDIAKKLVKMNMISITSLRPHLPS